MFDMGAPRVKPGKWLHMCYAVRQRANKQHILLVVDGVLCLNSTDPYQETSDNTLVKLEPNFFLGNNRQTWTGWMFGHITDFNIWARVLNLAEMTLFTKNCKDVADSKGIYYCKYLPE